VLGRLLFGQWIAWKREEMEFVGLLNNSLSECSFSFRLPLVIYGT
jgi:hypothetical protein